MDIRQAKKIVGKLQDEGIDAKVRPSYEGRFGAKPTAGVVAPGYSRDICPELNDYRTDSMGLSTIWY